MSARGGGVRAGTAPAGGGEAGGAAALGLAGDTFTGPFTGYRGAARTSSLGAVRERAARSSCSAFGPSIRSVKPAGRPGAASSRRRTSTTVAQPSTGCGRPRSRTASVS